MKKIALLNFTQKNDLIVKHVSGEYFGKDLDLFRKHFPTHKLNNELARANPFTYSKLDGAMLNVLLDQLTIDEILDNRDPKEPEPRTLDQLKSLILSFNILNLTPEILNGIDSKELEEINQLDDDNEIKNAIDDYIDPKFERLDDVKLAFINAGLNISGVPETFFDDFLSKSISEQTEKIKVNYSFMVDKPEQTTTSENNNLIEGGNSEAVNEVQVESAKEELPTLKYSEPKAEPAKVESSVAKPTDKKKETKTKNSRK